MTFDPMPYCPHGCEDGWLDRNTEDIRACPLHKPKQVENIKRGLVDVFEHGERMASMPYEEYLQTREWRARRRRILERDGWKCGFCTSSILIQVHHLSYENRGYEFDHELVTVCRSCHESLHGIAPHIVEVKGKRYVLQPEGIWSEVVRA